MKTAAELIELFLTLSSHGVVYIKNFVYSPEVKVEKFMSSCKKRGARQVFAKMLSMMYKGSETGSFHLAYFEGFEIFSHF